MGPDSSCQVNIILAERIVPKQAAAKYMDRDVFENELNQARHPSPFSTQLPITKAWRQRGVSRASVSGSESASR